MSYRLLHRAQIYSSVNINPKNKKTLAIKKFSTQTGNIMEKILLFSEYLIKKYGKPLQRIPVSLPLSCPHREKNSGRGCIFCAEDGSRARHLKNHFDLKAQIESGIEYAKRRYNAEAPYIAYFQAFTNTYAELETLKKYYTEVLSLADFAMVIVATRPDCLEDKVIGYLAELNQKYEVWVELGVQSAQEKTLALINRQHDFECVKDAVQRLDRAGIKVAAHMMLGLPGETLEDFKDSARKISALPFSAVKLHNLLVLKNTPLAKLYAEGKCPVMNEYDYAFALVEVLKILPDGWPVMRLNADADPKETIAPRWWMKKSQFLAYVSELFESSKKQGSTTDFRKIPGIRTGDGSFTLYHPEYRQHFHTLAGAATEAQNKFIIPSGIKEKLQTSEKVSLLDIGFGLGYNAAAAIKCARETGQAKLEIISLEKDMKTLQAAEQFFAAESLEHRIISALHSKGGWNDDFSAITILSDDARKAVPKLEESFDCIFLDAFSTEANPELWTYDFIKRLASLLKPDGTITTYSAAFPVMGAFLRCGLHTGETEAFGRKRGGLIASNNIGFIRKPLSDKDLKITLNSTAGLPYRDPGLDWHREKIIEFRDKVTQRLRSRGIPKWFKE